MIQICTLASGSSGNSYYAQTPDGAVIVDAGISAKRITEAVKQVNGQIGHVDGVVLTHDHGDHSRGAGVISRQHDLPLFMTEGTARKIRDNLKRVASARTFKGGTTLCIGGFHIHTFVTPHDGVEPVALVLERNQRRIGILTDLGHVFPELTEIIPTLDALFIESNYDPEMLARGDYPASVKNRIASDHGHICNTEAAELIRDFASPKLKIVMLSHLSENSNTPKIALDCFNQIAGEVMQNNGMNVFIAPRHKPSDMITITE